jgi:hypothetical protein
MAKLVQGVRPATGMTTRGLLQGWLFLMAACGCSPSFSATSPPGGDGGAEKDPDYPALFQDLSHYLNRYYLDLDRISPRNLIEKAFAAMENAVDEIYVENSDPQNPVLVLHVDGHAESFNVSTVTSLETAVNMLERVFVFVKENYHGETPINEVRYAAANGFLAGSTRTRWSSVRRISKTSPSTLRARSAASACTWEAGMENSRSSRS